MSTSTVSSLHEQALREQAEGALKACEERYRILFEHTQIGVVLADSESYYIDANASACRMLGYSRDELIGLHASDIVSPTDTQHIRPASTEIHGRSDHHREWQFRRKDGSVFPADVIAIKTADGTLLGLIRDISDHEQIHDYREHLAAIVESSRDAIIGKDLNGIVTSWNAGAATIFGYAADEMLGTSITRLIPDDRREEETLILSQLRRGERIEAFETMRWTKDRRLIEVSVTISPIRDVGGSIVGASKIARDITTLKQHEREVARLSRLYAALSQINKAIVSIPARDELFRKICRVLVEHGKFRMAWVDWHDSTTNRLIPVAECGDEYRYLQSIDVCSEDPPEGRGPSCTAFRSGRPCISNDLLNDPTALPWREERERRSLRASAAFPIRMNGEVCGTLNVYADQPEFFHDKEIALLEEAAGDLSFALDNFAKDEARNQAEQTLRESEERFRELAETIQEVFWIADPISNQILYISPAYEKIWGRTCASLYESPLTWREAIHPDDRERVLHVAETKQTRGAYDETYRILRPNGAVRWIHDRAFPVRNAAGDVLRIVGTAEDITDRRQLEEQFHQSQKMEAIGQLAGGVAHDFNNILAAILGNTQLALADTADEHPARESLEEINKSSIRARSLIQQILAFGRHQPQERRVIELGPPLQEAYNFLRATIPSVVELVFSLDAAAPPVLADPTQVYQVITNLCTNAWHALKGCPGRVEVRLESVTLGAVATSGLASLRPGRFACLSVIDNGTGMDAATLERIFDPFFTTKEAGKGTGLGLSVVHGIVKGHNGAITVASQPGHGTTFLVYFPAATGPVDAAPAPVPAPLCGEGQHILYLDDEEALVFLATRMLKRLGYHISGYTRVEDAMKAFRENPYQFDLVITDLNMPGAHGMEVAADLLQLRPDLPVVLCSGHVTEELRESARNAGIREVLYKPNTMEEFSEAIHRLAVKTR